MAMLQEEDTDFVSMLGSLDDAQLTPMESVDPLGVPPTWPKEILRRGVNGNTLTAVPPNFPKRNSFQSRNNSGNIMASRLRAASDMHMQGMISGDEKALMKSLILSRDPQFREIFAQAEKQRDWERVRDLLRSGKFDHHSPYTLSADALNDFADVNLGELPEDIFSVLDSMTTGSMDMGSDPHIDPQGFGMHGSGTLGRKDSLMLFQQQQQMHNMQQHHYQQQQQQQQSRLPHHDSGGMPGSLGRSPPPAQLYSRGGSGYSMPPMHGNKPYPMQPITGRRISSSSAPGNIRMHPNPAYQQPRRGGVPPAHVPSPLPGSIVSSNQRSSKPPARRVEPTKPTSESDDADGVAKQRKNERERKRRLAVSQGFDNLLKILKMPEVSKVDKATILTNGIQTIQNLEKRCQELKRANAQLKQSMGTSR